MRCPGLSGMLQLPITPSLATSGPLLKPQAPFTLRPPPALPWQPGSFLIALPTIRENTSIWANIVYNVYLPQLDCESRKRGILCLGCYHCVSLHTCWYLVNIYWMSKYPAASALISLLKVGDTLSLDALTTLEQRPKYRDT